MQSGRTRFLSIAAPVCVTLVYVLLFFKPWSSSAAGVSGHLTPDAASDLWEQSRSLYQNSKYEDALPGVLRLHDSFPGNHIYMEMAAQIYGHLGRYPDASKFWEMYLDRAPDPAPACLRLGKSYHQQKKDAEEM